MTTTFTGPHHGPWGADETFTKVRNKSTKTKDEVWGGYWTHVSAHVWDGALTTHTPTTTWAGPGLEDVNRAGNVKPRPARRPGVTPVPFPKSAPDRIGPFTVDEVMAASYDGPMFFNNYGLAVYVCDVLRRLYGEGKR